MIAILAVLNLLLIASGARQVWRIETLKEQLKKVEADWESRGTLLRAFEKANSDRKVELETAQKAMGSHAERLKEAHHLLAVCSKQFEQFCLKCELQQANISQFLDPDSFPDDDKAADIDPPF